MTPGDARRLDVVAVGNALVDVLVHAPDELIGSLGLARGSMQLVDRADSERIYAAMGPGIEVSGGSAANTAVGVVALGGSAGYVGRVGDDALGEVFAHDIRAAGVEYANPPVAGGATGRCLVLVTADGQRTMCTHLGVASGMGRSDIDPEMVCRGAVVYLEGYVWDLPPAKQALRRAAEMARAAGARVALSLSDPLCVERHRDELLELVCGHVDIVLANEDEVRLLFGAGDLGLALDALRDSVEVAAVTRGPEGSVVVSGTQTEEVDAEPAEVVDTTGAGDLYAAGFLVGATRGAPLRTCARLGGLAAAEVIGHLGARPQAPLGELAQAAALL